MMSEVNTNHRKCMEEALRIMKGNEEMMERVLSNSSKVLSNSSKMMFHKYRSLIDVGFSETQAFQLVLQRGLE